MIALAVLLAVFPAAAGAAEDLRDELIELKRRLREEEAAEIREKIEAYNRRKDLESTIRTLDREWDEVQIRIIGFQNRVGESQEENIKLTDELDGLEKEWTEIRKVVSGTVDRFRSTPGSLFPHRINEKTGQLRELSERLKSGEVQIDRDLADTLEILRREIRLGETSGYYPGLALENGGEPVRVLRLGRVAALFLSRDESRAGVLLRKQRVYTWEDRLSEDTAARVRHVFAAFRESGVDLVGFPLDVTLGRRSQSKEQSQGLAAFFIKGGPIMVPLLLIGIAAFVMIGVRFTAIRRSEVDADGLMDRVSGFISRGDRQGADELLARTAGPAARMLRAGVSHSDRGKENVEEAMDNTVAVDLPALEKYLSAISVLGSIAPLLGLLGTVSGMINTFDVITRFGSGDPKLLSGGISEALITTEVGLAIAIPVLLLHNHLTNRIARIAADLEKCRIRVLNLLFP